MRTAAAAGGDAAARTVPLTRHAPRPPPPPARAENPVIESFDVEYYRTLSGGNPAEVFRAAMFTPELQDKRKKK